MMSILSVKMLGMFYFGACFKCSYGNLEIPARLRSHLEIGRSEGSAVALP